MRIGLAQIDTIVGNIEYNYKRIITYTNKALDEGCDIVSFPELSLTGYPPEDLLTNRSFVHLQLGYVDKLKEEVKNIILVFGFVNLENDILYNSAGIVYNGRIYIYNKTRLPNYGVFDEKRYFGEGNKGLVVGVDEGRVKIGINICEDIWYPEGVILDEVVKGYADILMNISSSPYHIRKGNERIEMLKTRARDYRVLVTYTNLVGGQDELVFDGNSLVISPDGNILVKAKSFEEDLVVVDIQSEEMTSRRLLDPRYRFLTERYRQTYDVEYILLDYKLKNNTDRKYFYFKHEEQPEEEEIIQALLLSIKDYVSKNNFCKVVLGVSGGIDSALVAYLCAKALGKDNVIGVSMPSRFSSEGTRNDAKKVCENLGIRYIELSIENIFKSYLSELQTSFEDKPWDITEENLQARIRGNILMALSNKFGWLVVSTGNKSELSMGYSTLYGDMVGGFALIKDIYKTTVYRLVEYINRKEGFDIIPRSIIERPPTAELRENQKDEDTLPPYHMLDKILKRYLEAEQSPTEISEETGIDIKLIKHVIEVVDKNEYKRRQAPIGTKITPRSFGKDRRYPITNQFKYS
ncbi:MAG: NAD+ synthase [Spirochaetia bacterium]|nr:NAD+ synthase [Spirochaetota bacterium]MCX8096012.1 NAD+ synthase [Spirochaetota bacterium]MDW8111807.1 NAD+ synthase [Spirochaetia bacterium]